jgi:chromosomal replication initiator protein
MKAQQAWQAVLGQLQMEMPKAAFDTWVRNAELVSYEDGAFIIGVPNAYARDWLHSRLLSTVTRLLTGIMNRTVQVNFTIWKGVNEASGRAENIEQIEESERPAYNPTLNPRYSFENFVVGPSNIYYAAPWQS